MLQIALELVQIAVEIDKMPVETQMIAVETETVAVVTETGCNRHREIADKWRQFVVETEMVVEDIVRGGVGNKARLRV